MSEEALKKEIATLTKRVAQLEADLRAERGEQTPGEIMVRRYGTDTTSPKTLHLRLSIADFELMGGGERFIDYLLGGAKHHLMGEIERRKKAEV
ncbi:hypothetical protein [Methylobacterium sp. Gmos1]